MPGCSPTGRLQIVKTCEKIIKNNTVTLQYLYNLSNIGNATIDVVSGTEQIIYDAVNIAIGTIVTDPPTLTVDTSITGVILVKGTVGPLAPG
ncbi:MAG: hypothetical protein K6T29_01870, partial [Peptococcaceae bacterium]|nr:hypothetical protein [Peptococcaceae bacterium]